MSMAFMSTQRVYRVAHMACGIGAGAKGFNQARFRVGDIQGRFECAGGIDVDAGAIRNFSSITGTPGTVLDLFDRDQYAAFHGKSPPSGWREACPDDIRGAFGPKLDVIFASYPCKGFSGLLSTAASGTDKYQALNALTLRGIWLALEAYKDDPVPILLFENVPRIAQRGRFLLERIQALYRAYGYVFAESVHDCGEVGGLAQSRKRFLLVARHISKIPNFLYEPPKSRLRGVGEVIGRLPLPGIEAAGPMHRVPMLQWKTWVRLAFVRAGSDWRSLNDLRVADGFLTDYGITPEMPLRDNAYGVLDWRDTAPTVTSARAPGQGRFSVADPRDVKGQHGVLGVRSWDAPSGAVTTRSGPTNGTFAVADPRPANGLRRSAFGVVEIDKSMGTVQGESGPTNGRFAVADPRPPGGNTTYQQYGVKDWVETASAVTGQSWCGGGPHSVADPRLGRNAFANIYRIVAFDQPATSVTSSRDVAVADPRPPVRDDGYKQVKYKVTPFDAPSGAVISASTTGTGAFAVADPRPEGFKGGRKHFEGGGHYGVIDWCNPAKTVSGSASHDNGYNCVADPRDAFAPAVQAVDMPKPNDRVIARIIALDDTWHRPFTTLELAALQSLFDPDEIFSLDGSSDAQKREWIGNAVPSAAARGMAETIGETLLRAELGETFTLSSREIWTRPLALALAVDPRQPVLGDLL
jgi:site-specific DNA-cytosine methylase